MKTKYYNQYSYKELLTAATAPNAEQIDIDTLGAWFEQFDPYWNGEYYNADGHRLFPTYSEYADGDFELIGYEFR